jgi:hypothetical protein
VTYSKAQKSWEESESRKTYDKRTAPEKIWLECRRATFKAVSDKWYGQYPDLRKIGFGNWAENELARGLLQLFVNHPQLREAREFFERIASALRTWWGMEHRRRQGSGRSDYELELEARDALASFLLASESSHLPELLAPILEAVEKSPKGVAGLMKSLLTCEDGRQGPSRYWEIWKAVAGKAVTSEWISGLDYRHEDGRDLIRDLFLNTLWKEKIQTWSRLGEHYRDIDWLYQQMPPSAFVLEKYAHYLYHIGGASVPQALVSISNKLGNHLDAAIAADGDNIWYFDTLLSRAMYADLPKLKETQPLRNAVMSILDALVNAGSSIAFRLRDDFVTP